MKYQLLIAKLHNFYAQCAPIWSRWRCIAQLRRSDGCSPAAASKLLREVTGYLPGSGLCEKASDDCQTPDKQQQTEVAQNREENVQLSPSFAKKGNILLLKVPNFILIKFRRIQKGRFSIVFEMGLFT